MNRVSSLFRENMFTPEEIPAFKDKLVFEGARQRPYLVRFTVLLFLSTVIAAYGVLNDSTATVIGAMIIAPLMTPIMASAAALVVGQGARVIRSLALVGAGVMLVIVVSWLIGTVFGSVNVISFSDNSQITGRISPRLSDLMVAIASGAAGAFAMSREDIADSLPGVAISISLVPPLCVVGIGLSDGEWLAAWGALLLFLTNFLSILLAGGGVLAFLGLERATNVTLAGRGRRNAFLAIALGVLLVSIPLLTTSLRLASETVEEYQTLRVAQEWVSDTGYDLRAVRAQGNEIEVLIAGEGEPPETTALVSALEGELGQGAVITLEIVPLHVERLQISPARE